MVRCFSKYLNNQFYDNFTVRHRILTMKLFDINSDLLFYMHVIVIFYLIPLKI